MEHNEGNENPILVVVMDTDEDYRAAIVAAMRKHGIATPIIFLRPDELRRVAPTEPGKLLRVKAPVEPEVLSALLTSLSATKSSE